MTKLEQIMVRMGFDVSESGKVNDAMNKVKEGAGKASEGVAGFNTHGREMHELIHKIGASSPLMGSALKAAFNPEALGIVAVIAVLEWFKTQFEKVKEQLKELARESTELWAGQQEHAVEAAKAVEEFHRKMTEATEAARKQGDAYKDQIDALDSIYDGHKKVMGAVEETLDLDKKRARQKEDEARKEKQQSQLEAVGGDSVKEAALRKQFEMDERRIRATREYQDEADKQAKQKRERANEEAINKAKLDVLQHKNEKQFEEQKRLQAKVPAADAELLKEANRKSAEDAATMEKERLKKEMAELTEKANAGDEKAGKELAAKQSQYKVILDSLENLKHKDEEAVRNAEKISAEWKKNQDEMQATYREALKLDAKITADAKAGRAIDAEDAKRLARLRSDIVGNSAPGAAKAAALASTLANDPILQQARQRLDNAQTMAERNYWQNIVNSQTRFDRSRFPGVPTPEEMSDVRQDELDENKQQTGFLKDIRDLLKGDQ